MSINTRKIILLSALFIFLISMTTLVSATENDTTNDLPQTLENHITTQTDNSFNTNLAKEYDNEKNNQNKTLQEEYKKENIIGINSNNNLQKTIKNEYEPSSITLDVIDDIDIGDSVDIHGYVYDKGYTPLSNIPIRIILSSETYFDNYTIQTNDNGEYEDPVYCLPQGNYHLKVSIDGTDNNLLTEEQDFIVNLSYFDNIRFKIKNNGSYLNNSYNIGGLHNGDKYFPEEYISLNVTVNGEMHTITSEYDGIIINNSIYSSDNPIFTTSGDNNITIRINGEEYGSFIEEIVFNTVGEGNVIYFMTNNGTYLSNSYFIGYLCYGNENNYEYLSNLPVNITVNGEKHLVTTDYNGRLIIDNQFNSNNHIFTDFGDNNITISFNHERYGDYSNTTIFNIDGEGSIFCYINNKQQLSDYYSIGYLSFGNDNNAEYISNIKYNLTVNGETHELTLWGNIVIDTSIFNKDNPIFTRCGYNTISFSFNNEKYGQYSNNTTIIIYEPSIILKELNDKYENIKVIDINCELKDYPGERTVMIHINDESIEVYNEYNYNNFDNENYTYRFIPESPGNYTIYADVQGDRGYYRSDVEKIEVISLNENKLKLNVTLSYNDTAYKGETLYIYGKVVDENNQSVIGNFTFDYDEYYTFSDGTFKVQINTEYYDGLNDFIFIFGDEDYEETIVYAHINIVERILDSEDIYIVWDEIEDIEYSNSFYLCGTLYDMDNNPISGMKISSIIDDKYNLFEEYTDNEGKFAFSSPFTILDIGSHNLSAIIETDNDEYMSNITFNIIKAQPIIVLYGDNIRENIHGLELNGYVNNYYPNHDERIIYIKLNNQTFNTTYENDWSIRLPVNKTGNYNIEVFILEGDNNYESRITSTITVISINDTKLGANLILNDCGDIDIQSSIYISGYVLNEEDTFLKDIHIKVKLSGDNYNEIYELMTDNYGNYGTFIGPLPQGMYHIQAIVNDSYYESEAQNKDFYVNINNIDSLTFEMENNGTYLKDSYNIGKLIRNDYPYSQTGISINVTINGETHTFITEYDGVIINKSVYNDNNPIFTTAGDNEIIIRINGEKYVAFEEEFIFTTTEANVAYRMYNNGTTLRKSYLIGHLHYGNEEEYEYLINTPINVTVNGERHEINTTTNGLIYVNDSIFNKENPIFTIEGENNIIISLDNLYYGEFAINTIFSTDGIGNVIFDQYNNLGILNTYYYLGKLMYGNEEKYEYFYDIPVNLTVNGETRMLIIYSNVYISKDIFNEDNPVFTTLGVNNISISVNNNEYGEYYKEFTFTTEEIIIKPNPIESKYPNDSTIISGYVTDGQNNKKLWAHIYVYINDNDFYYTVTDENGYYEISYMITNVGKHNVTIKTYAGVDLIETTQEFYGLETSSEDYIKELEDKLSEYEELIKQLNQTIINQNATIEELNINNTMMIEENNELTYIIKQQNSTIKSLNNTVKTQNTTIKNLNNTNRQLNNTIKNQNSTINNLEKQITNKENTIKQQNKTIINLNNTIKNQNTTINNLQKQNKELNNTIKQQNNTINTLIETNKKQNTTINNLQKQNKELNNTIKTLNNTNKKLNNNINNLTNQIKDLNIIINNLNKKNATTITVNKIVGRVGSQVQLKATVKDQRGIAVNEGKVVFKVNGITLKDSESNPLYAQVTNGVATLNYVIPKSWMKNDTKIEAVFSETSHYVSSRNTTTNNNITPGNVKLKIADMPVHENGDNTQFVITAVDERGNTINGGTIILKANGVTLKDSNGKALQATVQNGVAIIDYNITLGARVHDITAVYAYTGYNRIEAKNKLTVTKGEIFIKCDPVTTKTNTTTITATVYDKNKKPVAYDVDVGIKVNGATITSTTTVKGVVNVTIPTKYATGTYLMQLIAGETGAYKSDRLTTVIIKQ